MEKNKKLGPWFFVAMGLGFGIGHVARDVIGGAWGNVAGIVTAGSVAYLAALVLQKYGKL